MTSCRYWPPSSAAAVKPGLVEHPLRRAVQQREKRLAHHVRSNQRCTPVIGEARKLRRFAKYGLVRHDFRGQQFRQGVLRNGGEIIVRGFHRAVFPFHAADAAIGDEKSAHSARATELPRPALG